MHVDFYRALKELLVGLGYSGEIDWATTVGEPADSYHFAREAIWVILNSGMKMQVAQLIGERIWPLLRAGKSSAGAFRHKLKCKAIDDVWTNREAWFLKWNQADDKLAFLVTIPHIGDITKFHLARNLGMDVCKPDRHLVRIAGDETPAVMCQRLADATGDRIGVVDCVIWRAANLGLV